MINVFIADDHPIVRQGLKQILSETEDMRLAGEAADSQETLHKNRTQTYDVLVLDISMPDISGLEILELLVHEHPKLPVLMLSMHAETQYAVRCLKAGAAGYLTKDCAPSELVKAIRQVVSGSKYVSEALAGTLALHLVDQREMPAYHLLSNREFDVLQRMGNGQTVSEIAETLSLSVKTVSTYRGRILKKLNLSSSAEIIRYAILNRLSLSI